MRYALNATTILGVDQYLARRPRLVRIFTTGSPTGYRRRIEYPGLKGIWRSYFYSFFTMTPKGKYPISVCLGTACYVRGAENVLEEMQRQLEIKVGETTPDGLFSLDCLRCVGACGLAPVVMIGGKVYGRVTPEKVRDILSDYYLKEQWDIKHKRSRRFYVTACIK